MGHFDYLIDKINNADFASAPFKHVYIENFFEPGDFENIIGTPEIAAPPAKNDMELIQGLYGVGYKVIPFPGCVTDIDKYVQWHGKRPREIASSSLEGFGMALRLFTPSSPILKDIKAFLEGEQFNRAVAGKFGVNFEACTADGGIQKYLDGYEISPHADIRGKATTFMVNINPSAESEKMNHHTHYMRFKPEREYVRAFWEGNPSIERCWVPWDWTETVSQQVKNNSIVIFSPSDTSLHAVKADYDHLRTQRTQLYGNLWYKNRDRLRLLEWQNIDLLSPQLLEKPAKGGLRKLKADVLSYLGGGKSGLQVGRRHK